MTLNAQNLYIVHPHFKPVISAQSQIFHNSSGGKKNRGPRVTCAVGVLNFYSVMCRRSKDFKQMAHFLRNCHPRYLNPHYMRAVIVNPALIATRYVCTSTAYKKDYNGKNVSSGQILKMRFMLSSQLMSNIVQLLIASNQTNFRNPGANYNNSPTLTKYMEVLEKHADLQTPADLEKANLDQSHFRPENALDAMLYHYHLAISTLTASGDKTVKKFDVCDQRFPLSSLWKQVEDDRKRQSINVKSALPIFWTPQHIHESLAKGEYDWRFIMWPKAIKGVEPPPPGLAPEKNSATPGKLNGQKFFTCIKIVIEFLPIFLFRIVTPRPKQ